MLLVCLPEQKGGGTDEIRKVFSRKHHASVAEAAMVPVSLQSGLNRMKGPPEQIDKLRPDCLRLFRQYRGRLEKAILARRFFIQGAIGEESGAAISVK